MTEANPYPPYLPHPRMKLTERDLQNWLRALTAQPRSHDGLMDWIKGPLRDFFPFTSLFLGHGEQVAGQIQVTHWLAHGHDDAYLHQLASTFDVAVRGSFAWWLANRQPFYIDPARPSSFVTPFELDEIRTFGLGCIAAHGIINARTNAGTYFSFAGIPTELSDWHLDALTLIAPVLNDLFLSYVAAQQKDVSGLSGVLAALTPRQKDIVRLITSGLDDKAIARRLGIAEKTVRNQLTEVYSQLGVRKRAQLMTAGYGLILSEPADAQERGWMGNAIKASEALRCAHPRKARKRTTQALKIRAFKKLGTIFK